MDSTIQTLRREHAAEPSALNHQRLLAAQERAGDERAGRLLRVLLGTGPVFQEYLVEAQTFGGGGRITRAVQFGTSARPQPREKLSIQAGATHYCRPRYPLPYAAYTAWEIAYNRADLPAEVEAWMGQHWEDPEDSWSVAGYVPTETVQRLFSYLFVEHGEPCSLACERGRGVE